MVLRVVNSEAERTLLYRYISKRRLPMTVEITEGRHRSVEQNRLQRAWIKQAAEQMEGHTPEELRGYCKLVFGVPILRAENEAFRERYDAVVRPLPYEAKLAIMMEPLDLPVTRLMNVDQKTRYLNAIAQHFAEQGVVLTEAAA